MISRKEKAIQRKKARQKRVVTIILIVTGIVAALAVVFSLYSAANRSMTAIEKVASQDTDALFISKMNDESTWNYFMYLSGYNVPVIDGVKQLGYAHSDNRNFLYLSGDTEKIKSTLSDQGIKYGEKDSVIALGDEGFNFSDNALADDSEYKDMASKNGNRTTFAYVDFEALSEALPASYAYAVPHLSTWMGTFTDGVWSGPVTNVNRDSMDETKRGDEVAKNPLYRDFVTSTNYRDDDGEKWAISPVTLGLLADKQYNTAVHKIDFSLSGDTLSLNIKQED